MQDRFIMDFFMLRGYLSLGFGRSVMVRVKPYSRSV